MGLRANLMHIFGVILTKKKKLSPLIEDTKCLSRIYQLLRWSRTAKNWWHPKAARFSLTKMEHSGNHSNSQNSEWALLLVTDFGRLVNIETYKEIEPWVWACVQLKLGNPQITRNHFWELWQIYNEENAIEWTPKDRKQNIPTLKLSE